MLLLLIPMKIGMCKYPSEVRIKCRLIFGFSTEFILSFFTSTNPNSNTEHNMKNELLPVLLRTAYRQALVELNSKE